MLKRTIWYACLVLLCCGLSALVVLATSAGKTTLLPADTTSADVRAPAGSLVPTSAPTAVTNDAKPEAAVSRQMELQPDVPSPSNTLEPPETGPIDATSQETRVAPQVSKGSQGEAPSEAIERGIPESPELARENAVLLRKERELAAVAHGMDPNAVSAASDADLVALISGSRRSTSEVRTPAPEAQVTGTPDAGLAVAEKQKLEEQADLAAEARGPVAMSEPEAAPFSVGMAALEPAPEPAPAPVFEASGEAAGSTLAPEEQVVASPEQLAEQAFEAMISGQPLTAAEKELALWYEDTHPDAARGRGSLDNSGGYGAGAGGYRFYDNVAPDTSTYSWIELRGAPGVTWIKDFASLDDGYSAARRPIGFSFPFFGVNQDSFRVCTNGYIQFTTTATAYSETDLPASAVAGPAIFAYWDDLYLLPYSTDTTVIAYKNFGTYTVIEFDSIAFYSSSCYPGYPLKFEVILYSSGLIRIQYMTVTAPTACLNSATVGIQGTGTGPALRYVYDATGYTLANGRAITFTNAPLVNEFACTSIISPTVGPYAPSASVAVTGRFTNLGSAAQTCPVKYRLNAAGAVVSEVTASLNNGQFEDHTFTGNITLRATNGTDTLVMWSDLGNDQWRANDTLRRYIGVFQGGSCESAIAIAPGSANPESSAVYNNAGAGDNSPGQWCATTSYNDMVFSMSVADGEQGEFWLTSALTNYHSLRWGGACAGTTPIACIGTAYPLQKVRYVNHTGSSQNTWFVIGGSSSTAGNFKLAWQRQAVSTYTIPYANGFEITVVQPTNPTYHTFPNFWSVENSNADAAAWENYNVTPFSGLYCARVSSPTAAGNDDWLFTPGLDLNNTSTYYLDYYRKAISTTIPESLEVKIGTQNASTAMTQTVVPWDSFKTNTWVQKGGAFTVPSAGTYYIGFHSYTRRSSAGGYLDSVRVSEGLCAAPTVTARDSSGATFALLPSTATGGWGGPVQYHWFTGSDCQAGNEIPYANASSYLATASGTYSLRAWRGDSATCGACDPAVATVTTPCTANIPAYIENFDDVTQPALPTCWSQENTNGDATSWATTNTTPQTGVNCAYIVGTAVGNNDWLFSELLTLSSDTIYVFEYWRRNNSTTISDCLEVKYGTQRLSGAMLNTIFPPDTSKSMVYVQKVTLFTPPATADYYVGFHSLSRSASAGTRVDSVHIYAYGLCSAPTVSVNAASGTYWVTLTANAAGGHGGPLFYQWYTGVCTAPTTITGATSSTYLAIASGIYSCRAWRMDSLTCGTCDSANVVLTCATPTVPPMFEGFESTTGTALPTCWAQQDLFYTSVYWQTTTATPHSGLRDAYIYGYSGTGVADDWMYTQRLALQGGTTYWLEYWRRNSTALYADSLEIMYGTQQVNTAMTNVLAAADTNKTTTWVRKTASFTPAVTGTYHIGFHCMSRWYTSSAYTYIDDIRVYPNGICDAPDSIRVLPVVGTDSVTLMANVYGGFGGSPQYQWYTGVNCQTGNEITGQTNATYKTYVSGTFSCKAWFLDADTCSACDSGYANVIPCSSVPATLPVFEGFESTTGTALPLCWLAVDVNADARTWASTTSYPRTGLRDAYCTYSSGTAANDWMFTRGIALTAGDSLVVEYWYRCYLASTSYNESLELLAGSAPNVGSMTSIVDPNFIFSNVSTYTLRSRIWVVPSTGTFYFGWHAGYLINQGGVCVDDIAIYGYGTCAPPTSVTVNSPTGADSAKMICTVIGGMGGPANRQWYTGAGCQTGNAITGATAESLWVFTAGTYSCKVWFVDPDTCSLCASGYANVIDCDIPQTLPVYEGFESTTGTALPVCWIAVDVNGDGIPWRSNTVYPRTGLRHAFNSYSSGTATNDWMFTRGIALTAGDSLVVDYWYRCYLASTSYNESLELMAGSAPNVGSMTSIVDPNFIFSNVATYTLRSRIWVVPSTGTFYFGWHAGYLINQGGVCVDDIKIYPYGSCGAPDSVRANAAVGTIYAKLTATVYGGFGGNVQYQWYTGLACQGGNVITGATAKDYYALASGVYSVKAWFASADTCAACDSALATVNPNPCAPASVTPFSEGFESTTGTALPTCWSQQDLNYTSMYWQTTTTTPHSGLRDVYIYGYSPTYYADDWMYTAPMVLQGGTTYSLGYWRRNTLSTYSDSLEIMYGTIPVHVYMTNVVAAADTSKTTIWVNKASTFTPAVTDTYYIGFHAMNRWYTSTVYTYLDDIMLWPTGTCGAPDSVRANAVTGTLYAKLTANYWGGFGGAPQYQWYTGLACQGGNEITGATAKDYYATTSGTYSVKVWLGTTACSGCDSAQATVNPDPCAPYAVTPFSEGFESTAGTALPTCWSQQDLNYTAMYWQTTTTTPRSGLRDVYIYGYGPTNYADDWMYTAPMVLQGGTQYALDYWRRNSAATYADSLEIMYGTIPLNLYMTNVVAAADTSKTTIWVNKAATFTPAVTDTYYVGFHAMNRWYTSTVYTYLDDIMLYRADTCAAPTVTVADSTRIGRVTMTAVMTGGIGAPIVYQWYTGGTCNNANRIVGATASSYQTTVSGTFSARVYRRDSTACAACDSGVATVLPIPPGDACTTAWTLTLVPNDSVTYSGTTVGFTADCIDSCGNVSQSLDVFYQMTLTECRRIAIKLTTGDMFLSVFESGMCCVRSFMCNDDVSGWSQTVPWEDIAWRPTGLSSYVVGELPAGVYYIRVGYFSTSSGAYILKVRDYGPCPCEITCQGGDVAEMAESRYDTTFYRTDPDGGCNSTPVAFGGAVCEQTICGTAFTYQRLPSAGTSFYRDTDWYLFTLTDRKLVSLTVNAEFPAGALVVDTNGCVGAVAMFGDTAVPACTPTTVSDTLDAGTYGVIVYPRYFAGNPLPSQYRATLTCACLVGPRPTDVTCRFDSADGTPTGTNYWNDMRIRWTADSAMVGTGTFTIYYNLNDNAFPGGAGWTLLASGITPVLGPRATSYADLNVVNATILRRFYVVVSVCE